MNSAITSDAANLTGPKIIEKRMGHAYQAEQCHGVVAEKQRII